MVLQELISLNQPDVIEFPTFKQNSPFLFYIEQSVLYAVHLQNFYNLI